MEKIESMANKKIKLAAMLHRKQQRDKDGLFVVEGIRLVEMAAQSDWTISFGLCTPEAMQSERVQKIIAVLEQKGVPLSETSMAIYRKASATESPQGILLVMQQRRLGLSELLLHKAGCIAVLDGLQDPGNAGTLLRTADAAGCHAAISLAGTVDLYGDKAVRASMGSLFHLPVIINAARADFLAYCQRQEIQLITTVLDKEARPYFQADFTKPSAIVFGNEGNGVSAELQAADGRKIYIPMAGQAESLNVAASSAVVLFEALRQRQVCS